MRIRKGCKYIYTDEARELVRRLFDPEAFGRVGLGRVGLFKTIN